MIKWILCFLLLATSAQAKTVKLSWDPSPTPSVTGYLVYVSYYDSMWHPIEADAGNALTYTVEGLENDEGHYFCVRAYDPLDKSVCSNIVHSPVVHEDLPDLDFTVEVEIQ